MVPAVWIEHTTYRLQGGCSTAELSRHGEGDNRAGALLQPAFGRQMGQRHSCRLASAAPWASASSFAQAICRWTRPPRPQSVEAMTRSRPTRSAKRRIRSATSSGCSTKLSDGIEPDLIVLLSDINMPGMDGLQLLAEIKGGLAGPSRDDGHRVRRR